VHGVKKLKTSKIQTSTLTQLERYKTGGGSYVPTVDEVDAKILCLLGK